MAEWDEHDGSAVPTVPRTLQGSVGWLTARALNVPRRPLLLGIAGTVVFVGALAGLLAIPHSAARAARMIAPQPHERPDTLPLVAARDRAHRSVRGVEDALGAARRLIERWATLPAPAVDTLTTAQQLRRDSLQRAVAGLAQLRERAATAPLLASYRALAESRELRGARVRLLLDSLTEIERAREQVGGVGGVDPVFVALTERAGEIGREILGLAEGRLVALEGEIALLRPPPPPEPPPAPRVDTLGLLAQLDTARGVAERAERALAQSRERHRELDERAERARAIATIGASPFAIFSAALVLGVCLGFGVAFLVELRAPRVGSARELEWIAGAPLLAVVRDLADEPERVRRSADQLLAPLVSHDGELYRQLYGRLADRAYNLLPTCVVSDEPLVAAAIAANLATASARSARATLVIDTSDANALAAGLGIPAEPGIAELLQRRAEWTSLISPVLVGRDRVMDVIPAGGPLTAEQLTVLREPFSGEVEHFSRRYDTLVVTARTRIDGTPSPLASALPQAVVCARIGKTEVQAVARCARALREQGVIVRGVVLWDAEEPETAPLVVSGERWTAVTQRGRDRAAVP